MSLELQLCALEAIVAGLILLIAFSWIRIRTAVKRQRGWHKAEAIHRPNTRRTS